MESPSRVFLSIVSFVVSMVVFVILGILLHEADIRGPLVGDDYLTDWSNWKYLTAALSLMTTAIIYWLARRRSKRADQDGG